MSREWTWDHPVIRYGGGFAEWNGLTLWEWRGGECAPFALRVARKNSCMELRLAGIYVLAPLLPPKLVHEVAWEMCAQ